LSSARSWGRAGVGITGPPVEGRDKPRERISDMILRRNRLMDLDHGARKGDAAEGTANFFAAFCNGTGRGLERSQKRSKGFVVERDQLVKAGGKHPHDEAFGKTEQSKGEIKRGWIGGGGGVKFSVSRSDNLLPETTSSMKEKARRNFEWEGGTKYKKKNSQGCLGVGTKGKKHGETY